LEEGVESLSEETADPEEVPAFEGRIRDSTKDIKSSPKSTANRKSNVFGNFLAPEGHYTKQTIVTISGDPTPFSPLTQAILKNPRRNSPLCRKYGEKSIQAHTTHSLLLGSIVLMVQGREFTAADFVRLNGVEAPYVVLDIEPEAGIAYVLPLDVSQVRTVLIDRVIPFEEEEIAAGDSGIPRRDAA
jgi:hypothetical protein